MKRLTLALMLIATPAWAEPCVSTLDELGELIRDLDGLENRDDLISSLVTIVSDPELRGACEKDEIRYDAAKKLHELALAAPASARGPIVDALLALAEKEPDLANRRAMVLNLDRMNLTGAQKTKAKALAEEFLPTSPHYPTVFGENGEKTTVNVVVHTANAENRFDYYKRTFRGAKMEERNGNLEIEYKVTPDDPTGRYQPVTYKILVKDERRGSTSNFDIFDRADSDDPAIEVFNYHSNYGSSLSRSIENGAAARRRSSSSATARAT